MSLNLHQKRSEIIAENQNEILVTKLQNTCNRQKMFGPSQIFTTF